MSVDSAGVDRALNAIGTTFRLARLYPPAHPAVLEALHHVGEALPVLGAMGTLEWKVGPSGLQWHGQHLLPRNAMVAHFAGLLYAHGVRAVMLHPGVTEEQVLALFNVATGSVPPDHATLGHITLTLARRSGRYIGPVHATPTPPEGRPAVVSRPAGPAAAPGPAEAEAVAQRATTVFRPDVVPADVEAKRALAAIRSAASAEEQRLAVDKLAELAPALLAQRDARVVAEAIAALDGLLATTSDAALLTAIDRAALALTDRSLVERMVYHLGEVRVPPEEREVLVAAVAGLASVAMPILVQAFRAAPAELRAPYRAAVRKAADRALEPLQAKLGDPDLEIVAVAAECVGLTGSPQAVELLAPLLRHPSEAVRVAALIGLAERGGWEISRPAIPSLKDESVAVRIAAARTVAAGGDAGSSTVLIRRLEQEPDEGVQAELLRAIGRLGAEEALELLARHAEPGGMMRRRSPELRAAAIDGLRHVARPEARGLLELYSKDKDPVVRKAAEAALK